MYLFLNSPLSSLFPFSQKGTFGPERKSGLCPSEYLFNFLTHVVKLFLIIRWCKCEHTMKASIFLCQVLSFVFISFVNYFCLQILFIITLPFTEWLYSVWLHLLHIFTSLLSYCRFAHFPSQYAYLYHWEFLKPFMYPWSLSLECYK